ncbi:MAG: hypothetical protein ACE5FN_09285 [Leptospirillia bacterium]
MERPLGSTTMGPRFLFLGHFPASRIVIDAYPFDVSGEGRRRLAGGLARGSGSDVRSVMATMAITRIAEAAYTKRMEPSAVPAILDGLWRTTD